MVVKEDQERVRLLLSDTITLLCRNGLSYKSEFQISALIGITLDKEDVVLVEIRDTIKNSNEEETVETGVTATESSVESEEETNSVSKSPSRKRRKYRKNSDCNAEIPDEPASTTPVKREQELHTEDIVFIKDEPIDSSIVNSGNLDLSVPPLQLKGSKQQQQYQHHHQAIQPQSFMHSPNMAPPRSWQAASSSSSSQPANIHVPIPPPSPNNTNQVSVFHIMYAYHLLRFSRISFFNLLFLLLFRAEYLREPCQKYWPGSRI